MVFISSSIACIVAREFLEAILFIQSYFGSIFMNDIMDIETKYRYYGFMLVALVVALILATALSIGVVKSIKYNFTYPNISNRVSV